jgi:SPP1 gp7 family putative phage head morphogenesis protein
MNLVLKNRLALLKRGRCCPGCGAPRLPLLQGEGRGEGGFTPHSALRTPHSFAARGDNIDLLYALGLPPEQVVEYFKSKGYAFSWDWYDVWQEAHTLAFTVAKAMRLDVLQTIRDEMQKVFDEGITLDTFRKELEPKLKALGWWGKSTIGDETGAATVQLGSPWRLSTIYNTNFQTGYAAARWKFFEDNAADRPYGMYLAVLDAATRPAHRALHGKVFPLDDPFWTSFGPPNGWG